MTALSNFDARMLRACDSLTPRSVEAVAMLARCSPVLAAFALHRLAKHELVRADSHQRYVRTARGDAVLEESLR